MTDFKLDHAGLAEVLKMAGTKEAVHAIAAGLGTATSETVSAVYGEDGNVAVDDYTTDRAASSVTVRHPLAKVWQARDGLLTNIASAAGLDVKAR